MCFSLTWATKYAIVPKMSLGLSGIDFDLIWGAFRVPGGGKVGSKRGSKKTSIFETPFFPILADLGCPGGSPTSVTLALFSLLFSSWGLIFLIGRHFGSF